MATKQIPAAEVPAKKTAAKKPAPFKIPKTIGACADLLYTTRQERLALDHDSKDMQENEKLLRNHIIDTLPKSEASGVAGKLARVSVVTTEVNQVEDWDKFYAYIKKTGFFHLLNRAINQAAIDEVLATGKKIPGVVKFPVVKVSLNKV